MAKFDPKSERDVANVLTPDVYDFTVLEAVEQVRKRTGAPMFMLRLAVHYQGRDWHVHDCVGTDFMEFKLRHLCDTLGLLETYEQGEIWADAMIGCSGRVVLTVEEDLQYGVQNKVRDYEKRGEQKPKPRSAPITTDEARQVAESATQDDDIPF